ncbi:PulJ/GspJ family protein [Fimbriimonas ginsengisoli]|uniref:Type II secretion system protein J n=1 Tax=Fimbriimonas ginsengisoli Gsoil 348 TaxID=661478 RepID=A0A068NYX2_FIMGI|nr:type II secretion system protein GspJ [Fimbriimonas ginsengisoli]AIE87569.1 hypothetical protein OP10G_4201 [Fimbriimonas ginsengisoli Gsoil 348]
MRRGLTLVELLITVFIVSILMVGVSRAYVSTIDYDSKMRVGREESQKAIAFEERVTDLIRHANLSSDANQTASFFIGSVGNGQDMQTVAGSGNADTLIFTAAGLRVDAGLLDSTDDFETQNQKVGPQGGIGEISLSTIAIGDASGKSGVFLRQQRPADGDPTQGGYESLVQPNVDTLKFEFFDGTDWLTTWDTRTMTTKRLPAAVRVTYRLSDENKDRILVVQVPASDVTTLNPVQQETAG